MNGRLRAVACAAFLLGGCSQGNGFIAADRLPAETVSIDAGAGKIKHVIVIVQENRSFNNLFYGFPGAATAKYGYDERGHKIALKPVGLETTWDIAH
ncbi:MAG: hypothetical protein JO030_03690, partial [Candidatus Eremiobacteraeota bacterium]|nr:hypothetical protein [Candidatus Eremiobacteraeota bacterium]